MKFKFIKYIILIILLSFYNSGFSNNDSNNQTLQKNNSSFNNDLFSGVGSYKYDFIFTDGQRGLSPNLSVNYNTARVDYLNDSGYGFNFGVESIFRSTKKGQDKLYELDEFAINSSFSYNELVKTGTGIFVGNGNNDLSKYYLENDSWIVKDINGNTYYFGENIESKQINSENNKTFRYLLSRKIDNFGNEIIYSYIKANNNIYLNEINYAFKNGQNPLYKIKIDYLDKSFSTSSYINGFKLENYKLLSSITLQTLINGVYIDTKKYELIYKDINTIFPKLIQIKEYYGIEVNNITNFDYYTSGIGINLLSKIDNGKGLITTLEYKAASLYKNTTVPFLLKTLYKTTYEDLNTNLKYSNTYDYYGGNFYFDPTNIFNRGYTGFSKVKILEDDGSYKTIYFHQSDSDKNNSIDSQNGEFEDHISKKGKIYREEEYDENGNIYTTKITKWVKQDKGNNIYFVLPERVTNILWNKDLAHIDNSETFEYDEFGNILKNIKFGEVNANTLNGDFIDIKNDKKIYEYKYTTDENNIFISKICEEKIKDNDENQISFNKYFYDNLGQCLVSKGLLTKKSLYYSEEYRYLNQNFTYDNGVLKTETDFLGNITSYEYDDYNLLPISKINPKLWIETYTYDYKIQKPTNLIDVNGINYKLYYDNFGNLIKKSIINPDTNSEIILEENIIKTDTLPNYIQNKKYIDSDNYITTRVFFDGFGREIEKKVSSKYNNKFSTTKTRYNKSGNKEFATYPKFENNIDFSHIGNDEKGNILTYDTLGRILTQTNKTGTTKFEYDLLKTTQINQKLVKKDLINDIFGNLLKVKEYNQNEIYETNYSYNNLNKFSKIVDAKGNIRNYNYDSLARLIKQEDLHDINSTNFGTEDYTYNDNSQVLSKKSMSGDIINYNYDELGRLLTENFGNTTSEFVYDIGIYSKGQISKTIKENYSEEYKYNFLGQKIEDKKSYSDNTYTLKYDYDFVGNIKKITYPDNKETSYIYENGYINKISYNNTEILSNIDYEVNNKYKKEVFSNGLTNEENFDYEYGYRLVSKKAYLGENHYQNLIYNFDNVGNIVNITDTSNLGIQKVSNYTYDDLNRLLSNEITDENNLTSNLSFSYDSIGNITYNSRLGDYSYTNGINPQSVTQIGTGNILNYNTNGNVNLETINGISKDYTYNLKGELLTSISNGIETNYLYDNNSSRIQKQTSYSGSTNLTRYLNNDFEIEKQETLDGSGNILTQTKTNKYIYLGNNKIFTVENKDNTENIIYNISDHLGGGSIDINNTGTVLQKSDYLPYGGSRFLERNNDYKNNYLFTGKELDSETGLQYFEVRYYNPDFGRFYGQDKVFWELGNTKRGLQVLQDPQQLNSYSYARNNPIIYVDPSGESAIDVGTGTPIDIVAQAYITGLVVIGNFLGESISDYIIGDKLVDYNASKNDAKSKNAKVQSSSVSVGGTPGGGGKKPEKEEKTNKEILNVAKDLGMKEVKDFGKSHGEKIFKKGSNYYSYDNTAHNGGVWKVFEKVSGKLKRIGTADKNLNIFKE